VRFLNSLRLSPATVIATIALMVALAGTGYAATSLPRNSVGSAQLQANAVTTSKVKNGSLLKVDFAANQIPRGLRGPAGAPGPPGAPGAKGPTGPAGPAGSVTTKWALVGKDGNLVAGTAGVVVVQSSIGQYYVNFGSSVTGHAIEVTPAFRPADSIGGRGTTIAAICGATGTTPLPDTISCALNNNTSTVFVVTFDKANSLAESHGFYIAVL
jgi:hypothetical protein